MPLFFVSSCVQVDAGLMLDENGKAVDPRTACAGNATDRKAPRRQQSVSVSNGQSDLAVLIYLTTWTKVTYAEPPWALPNMADFLPRLVKSWTPSIQKPALTTNPVRYSPRRTSTTFMSAWVSSIRSRSRQTHQIQRCLPPPFLPSSQTIASSYRRRRIRVRPMLGHGTQ